MSCRSDYRPIFHFRTNRPIRNYVSSLNPHFKNTGRPSANNHNNRHSQQRIILRRFSEIEQVSAPEQQVIVRHSEADKVVTLNVGGKEFVTLRSTLQMNPVLYDRVLKAEANGEFIKGAIFVDRDPAHFGSILQHLRNVADSITLTSSTNRNAWLNLLSSARNEVNIQIPENRAKLRELFIEARYFKIKELEDVLSGYDLYTWLASVVSGRATNPFHSALNALKIARRALLTTGGLGILIGSQNEALLSELSSYGSAAYTWISTWAPLSSLFHSGGGEVEDAEPKSKSGWFGGRKKPE